MTEHLQDDRLTLRISLNSGETVETVVERDEKHTDAEDDEIADDMATLLASDRPRWINLGHLVLFTGAISAIEVIE